jgi:hypothetical protein
MVKPTNKIRKEFDEKIATNKKFRNLQRYDPARELKFKGGDLLQMLERANNDGFQSFVHLLNKHLHIITMIGFMKEDESKIFS